MADIAEAAGLQPDQAVLRAGGKLFGYLWDLAWDSADGTTGGDADDLHDMRVAIRRLRSALGNFEGPKEAPLCGERLRGELEAQRRKLGKLGDALGAVRDHDVLIEYIADYVQKRRKGPLAEESSLLGFERHLQTERASAFGPLVKRINRSRRPGKLRESFARFAMGLPAAAAPPLSLRDAAAQVMPHRFAEVESHAGALGDPTAVLEHHELRKSLKRLRYSGEFFAPCYPAPIKPILKRLTQLQDLLGEMNDRTVLHQAAIQAFHPETPETPLPAEIAAFLQYGERRRRQLLGQARTLWSSEETQGMIGRLRM